MKYIVETGVDQSCFLQGEDLMSSIQIKQEPTKAKKVKSENNSEANFVKCEFCDYCCDKVSSNLSCIFHFLIAVSNP